MSVGGKLSGAMHSSNAIAEADHDAKHVANVDHTDAHRDADADANVDHTDADVNAYYWHLDWLR